MNEQVFLVQPLGVALMLKMINFCYHRFISIVIITKVYHQHK
jgi:hypothetical protein